MFVSILLSLQILNKLQCTADRHNLTHLMHQVKNSKTQVLKTFELAFSRGGGRHRFKEIGCADTRLWLPGRQQVFYHHLLDYYRTARVELAVLLCLWWKNPWLEELIDKLGLNREVTGKQTKTRRNKATCPFSCVGA